MSKFASPVRFDVEKYRKGNFGLWEVQVKDVLKQSRLHNDLNGACSAKGSDSSASGVPSFMGDGVSLEE